MKAVNKQTAVRAYFEAMGFNDKKPAKQEKPKPQRLAGGCLLYTLRNSRVPQHPPAPYYS